MRPPLRFDPRAAASTRIRLDPSAEPEVERGWIVRVDCRDADGHIRHGWSRLADPTALPSAVVAEAPRRR
jgi:hypothetical protein